MEGMEELHALVDLGKKKEQATEVRLQGKIA